MAYIKKTDAEIREIAKQYWAGKIFTTRDINPRDKGLIPNIFMILAIGGNQIVEKLKSENATLLYEYMKNAAPSQLNGYPCFLSARYLDADDEKRFLEAYQEIKNIMGDPIR
jgi:hypothetical protein